VKKNKQSLPVATTKESFRDLSLGSVGVAVQGHVFVSRFDGDFDEPDSLVHQLMRPSSVCNDPNSVGIFCRSLSAPKDFTPLKGGRSRVFS